MSHKCHKLGYQKKRGTKIKQVYFISSSFTRCCFSKIIFALDAYNFYHICTLYFIFSQIFSFLHHFFPIIFRYFLNYYIILMFSANSPFQKHICYLRYDRTWIFVSSVNFRKPVLQLDVCHASHVGVAKKYV